MPMTTAIALGTRGSKLAMRQTELIANLLREHFPGIDLRTVIVQTEGDRLQDRPLSQFGDKAVFVRAIERELLNGTVDLAVHSLKDVPADVETPGLTLVAFSARADPRDVLVSRSGNPLADLPPGSRVGTSSLRRRVQLAAMRPDVMAADIRGNVDTRLRKVRDGDYDAIILAAAGLERLGLEQSITEYLPVEAFVPDAGQGIMVVQSRVRDEVAAMAASVDDLDSRHRALAERAVVRALGAGCRSPVGAYATRDGSMLRIRAVAATADLRRLERVDDSGPFDDPVALGARVGRRLLEAIGR